VLSAGGDGGNHVIDVARGDDADRYLSVVGGALA
jgi:hypothetical protein